MLSMYFAIGLGGACGAIARAFLVRMLPATILQIPLPILIINIVGCLIIGIITEIFANYSPDNQFLKLFLTTGFLGGFTTFSTFSLDAGLLINRQLYGSAFLYIILSVTLSIAAFFGGLRIVKILL